MTALAYKNDELKKWINHDYHEHISDKIELIYKILNSNPLISFSINGFINPEKFLNIKIDSNEETLFYIGFFDYSLSFY